MKIDPIETNPSRKKLAQLLGAAEEMQLTGGNLRAESNMQKEAPRECVSSALLQEGASFEQRARDG